MPRVRDDKALEKSSLRWRRRAFIVWTFIGICALFWLFGVVLNVLSTPVSIIVWCLVFIFCLNPIVDALEARGLGRGAGTLIAYIVLVVAILLLGVILFAPGVGASSQFAALAQSIPGYAEAAMKFFGELTQEYADMFKDPTVQSWLAQISDSLYGFVGDFANVAGASIMSFGSFVANTAMIIGFAVIISFWIIMELPGINREMHRLVSPDLLEDFDLFTNTLGTVIGGYLKATLLQCIIIGLGCGVGYAVIGLPSPAALGIISGILNIIPVVGPWLGGAVAALVGITVSPLMAAIAIVIAVVIQQIVYTFISPMLMSDSVDIHPALVIFGLTCGSAIGVAMAGMAGSILGMLASIPIIAAAKALFVYYFERRTGRRIVSPDGVFFKAAVASEGDEVNPSLDAAAPTPGPMQPFPLPNRNEEQVSAIRERLARRRQRLGSDDEDD